ncbi:hypothetical protein B0H17DRAFT_718782 [Mycena rosella]|uniref:Uncharacterized protein n=1 Tax=Mycena rosella TaxID=1033263 RepID=A0AAD7GBB2_MYCRO|nr:hypothetical protein B0H17DRAFT_718782 [Mycena rosella]
MDTQFPWLPQVMQQSPNLEVLRLPFAREGGDAWEALGLNGVRLKELSVPHAPQSLLRYLASYSGLERVVIGTSSGRDDRAPFFWESVLPRHAESLKGLVCPSYSAGPWCFGRHNITLISDLRQLDTLEIGIDLDERWVQHEKDIVELFMEMASEMPLLRKIAIIVALQPQGGCRNYLARLQDSIDSHVDKTVDSFGAAHPSPAIAHLIKTHHQRSKVYRQRHPLEWLR